MDEKPPGGPLADPSPVTEPKRPSDSISFDLDDFDRVLVDELIPNSGLPARWAGFNAVRHTNRAWIIRETDPSMAVFRAITGEEEAATALFRALQRLGYAGADKLKPKNHVQKNAVTPFCEAVWGQLAPGLKQAFPGGFALSIDKKEPKPRIVIKIHTKIGGIDYVAEPVPPLELRVTEGQFRGDGAIDAATEKPADFEKKIAEHAATAGAASVKAYLKERANLRNRVLYAGDTGYPTVQTPVEPYLGLLRRNTFLILKLFLLIDGYEIQQSFARQCLLAFLKMLGDTAVEITFD